MTMSMYANRDAEGKKYLRCMLPIRAEWDGDEGDESLDVASSTKLLLYVRTEKKHNIITLHTTLHK